MKKKVFVIKPETRKRCQIIPLTPENNAKFIPISTELYSFFYETETIDFNIYFRTGNEIVEFIKSTELSHELLDQMWLASQKQISDLEICIAKTEAHKFENFLSRMRNQKFEKLLSNDSSFDRITLQAYGNLSSASQMIIRGGINKNLAQKAHEATSHLMSSQLDSEVAIDTISRMITCDPTLYDHCASVAMFSAIIGTKYMPTPLAREEVVIVSQCGLYHDAGKTCVPNHILNKPGAFTPEEYEIMKTHAAHGYESLMEAIDKGAPISHTAAQVALEHHERFTGKGYPNGLKGRAETDPFNGIHQYSRIVAIADVYSALLMKRVYKDALTSDEAIAIMRRNAHNDFDPEIFEPFATGVDNSAKKHEELLTDIPIIDKKKKDKSRIFVVPENETLAQAIKKRSS